MSLSRLAGRLRPQRGPAIVFAALFVVGTWFFFHLSYYGRPSARVGADGHYYYAFLVSAFEDHDLDFTNQYQRSDYCFNLFNYGPTPIGRPGNPYSVGPALLWAPFFLVAHAVARVAHLFNPSVSLAGVSLLHQRITLYGTFLYGFLALLLAYRVAGRRARPAVACLAAVAAIAGGSVVWYAIGQPSYSHAQSAFAAALFVDLWDPLRRADSPPSTRLAVLQGLALGLAADVRAADVVLCLLPLSEAIGRFATSRRLRDARREIAWLAIVAGVALVAFTPQLFAWKAIYGRFLTVPMGSGFMHWGAPKVGEALFSTRSGLFPYSPLWWIATFVGLPLWLARRERAAVGALLVLVAIAYVNGAAHDWWGGLAFGGRRFATLAVLVAVELAVLLERIVRAVEARPAAGAIAFLTLGTGALVTFTLALLAAWSHNAFYAPRGFSGPEVGAAGATALGAIVEDAVGSPLAWPANLAFAAAHQTEAARWDVVAGVELDPGGPSRPNRLDLASEAGRRLLARGFGDTPVYPMAAAPPARGAPLVESSPACILLPFNDSFALDVGVDLVARGGNGRVRLRFNGRDEGVRTIGTTPSTQHLLLAASEVRRGVNDLCIEAVDPIAELAPAVRAVELSRPAGR